MPGRRHAEALAEDVRVPAVLSNCRLVPRHGRLVGAIPAMTLAASRRTPRERSGAGRQTKFSGSALESPPIGKNIGGLQAFSVGSTLAL